MKMKKLLSIGALGLVIACSTSVASFAATTETDAANANLTQQEQTILKTIAKNYKSGEVLGITKDTPVKTALNNTGDIETELKAYDNGLRLLNYLKLDGTVNDNAHSIAEGIINKCKAASDPDAEFKSLQKDILNVKTKVMEKDAATGSDRANKETELKKLLANDDYNVTLGKNSELTTISIENKEDGKIALQVNTQDVENITKVLDALTLQDLVDINAGTNNILQ